MLIKLDNKFICDLKSIRNIEVVDSKKYICVSVCKGCNFDDNDRDYEYIEHYYVSDNHLKNAEFVLDKIWEEINKCCCENKNLDLAKLIREYAIYDEPVKYKPARTINMLENDF